MPAAYKAQFGSGVAMTERSDKHWSDVVPPKSKDLSKEALGAYKTAKLYVRRDSDQRDIDKALRATPADELAMEQSSLSMSCYLGSTTGRRPCLAYCFKPGKLTYHTCRPACVDHGQLLRSTLCPIRLTQASLLRADSTFTVLGMHLAPRPADPPLDYTGTPGASTYAFLSGS